MENVTKFRVRYAETDAMGVVYYGNYFVWMEIGRTSLIRDYGWTYRDMEKAGIGLPVLQAYARYAAPSFYDDEISVHSVITELRGPRIRIDYRIYRMENEMICEGFTEHAFMSMETRKVVRVPEKFRDQIQPDASSKILVG